MNEMKVDSAGSDSSGSGPPSSSADGDSSPETPLYNFPAIMPWAFLLSGAFMCGVATGVIPSSGGEDPAQRALIFVSGMFFVFSGLWMLRPNDRRATGLFQAGMCVSMGIFAVWFGGFAFVFNPDLWPDEWLGRLMFGTRLFTGGVVTVICFWGGVRSLIDVFHRR